MGTAQRCNPLPGLRPSWQQPLAALAHPCFSNELALLAVPVANARCLMASVQSDWILDDLVPATWRRHLPGIYGVVMSPLRLLSRLLGPDRLERLDSALGITWLGLNYGGHLLGAMPATVAAGAVAAAVAAYRRRDNTPALR